MFNLDIEVGRVYCVRFNKSNDSRFLSLEISHSQKGSVLKTFDDWTFILPLLLPETVIERTERCRVNGLHILHLYQTLLTVLEKVEGVKNFIDIYYR